MDARDSNLTDPNKIAMKMRVNSGHASAQQLKLVLVDSEGGNMHSLTCADEVLARCEGCQAFERAPHAPAGGTSNVAMFNEEVQADFSFFGDIIALHVMDVYSKYSAPIPVRTKNPQEVWDACCSSWIGVFGLPLSF